MGGLERGSDQQTPPVQDTGSLIGGGSAALRPGALSLAHGGVLFLDELGEHQPSSLDALRQPLESGTVRIHRAIGAVTFPARVLLVAAMNPCPCGAVAGCRCRPAERARYQRRLSGPLLDRFDLRLHVSRPDPADLLGAANGELSADVARRVAEARARAASRGVLTNAQISGPRLERFAPLRPDASSLLFDLLRRGRLSARGLHRLRRVALTIADLAGDEAPLTAEHVATALGLRAEPSALEQAS